MFACTVFDCLQIWDLGAGKQLSEFRDHNAPVTVVKFHPNEFFLASGSMDRYLRHVALLSCLISEQIHL